MNNFHSSFNEAYGRRGNHTVWLKSYPRGTAIANAYGGEITKPAQTIGVLSRRRAETSLNNLINGFFGPLTA